MTNATSVAAATSVDVSTGPEPIVKVQNLSKHFKRESGAITAAVDEVSFEVHAGEFVVLLGPSGCGKTTLLRMLAGLETPDGGTISIRGQKVFEAAARLNTPTEHRSISMVFQSYALWPHMTVAQNIAYPLKRSGVRRGKAEVDAMVARVLELVRIPDLAQQYPNQMSGGQQQRVALARALVSGSDLVLFDEPLSNVDAQVRERLRYELLDLQRELGFAAVYVTHDQSEAMGLANRIAVMGEGRIRQITSPRETYEKPRSRYVANFIGVSNEVPGTVTSIEGSSVTLSTSHGELHGTTADADLAVGDDATLVWRPEHAKVARDEPTGPDRFPGTVAALLFEGAHNEVVLDSEGGRYRGWAHVASDIAEGDSVWIELDAAYSRILKE